MFIKKVEDEKLFSLRDRFLRELEKEIKKSQIGVNEEILRQNLKRRMKKGNLI